MTSIPQEIEESADLGFYSALLINFLAESDKGENYNNWYAKFIIKAAYNAGRWSLYYENERKRLDDNINHIGELIINIEDLKEVIE